MKPTFNEIGIPPGYGFKRLLFSPTANALIVQTKSAMNSWRPNRLLYRFAHENQYRQIGTPEDFISQESPSVHSSKPLLAYSSIRHEFRIDGEGEERHSGDWECLAIFDLKMGAEVQSITKKSLRLPDGCARGWITGVVGFYDIGLFVTAGLSQFRGEMETVDYFICEVDFAQPTLKAITPLPAVFM